MVKWQYSLPKYLRKAFNRGPDALWCMFSHNVLKGQAGRSYNSRGMRVGRAIGLLALIVSAVATQVSTAQTDQDALLSQEQAAFSKAAAAVADCVVQIETFGGLERVGQELIADGPTTGTIVGKEGWIISSIYSFRQQPASILVSLSDGTRVPAKIVARDHARELALLKIEASDELPVPLVCPRNEITVGQWSIGLGRTFERDSVSQSIGIISALDRAYGKAVQTDAKVSPVNYGGPLVDLDGRVIGILAPISPGAILEGDSSQLYDSGVGFAIPLVDILERLPQLQAGKDIHSGRLGVVVSDQNEFAGPVKVAGAAPGSPAAKAGLKPGDTIVQAQTRKVELLAHLRHALGPSDAGSRFLFSVDRSGKRIDLEATLVDQVPIYRHRYLGIEAENIIGGGLRITNVLPNTTAAQSPLAVGDQILYSGDLAIDSIHQLREQVSIAELDVPLKLKIRKGVNADSKEIEVNVATWPNKLEPDLNLRSKSTSVAERKVDEMELTLGDFPNKAWAWCPAEIPPPPAAKNSSELIAKEEFGLLLLLPEPGDVDRNKLREVWSPLIGHGWCVAVVQSANKSRWSSEEIELIERVRAQIAEKRPLDAARTVVGGMGVGGRLAMIGAFASKGKVAGTLLLATPLEGVRVRRENSPSESLHYLIFGARQSYADFFEALQKGGYPSIAVPLPELVPTKWETVPVESIVGWLLGLGRI